MIKKWGKILGVFGLEVKSSQPPRPKIKGIPSCEDRLAHMKTLGFEAKIIFDVGAFIGRWSQQVQGIYPEAKWVLVEPNTDVHPKIRKHTDSFSDRVVLIEAAVADTEGTAKLNIWENPKHNNKITALAASSLLDHVQGDAQKILEVRQTTIDTIIKETGLSPDILKLDLQGCELAALKGGRNALASAELCIVEFGCLDAYVDRTTPRDLMDIFYDHGFVLYDIVDVRYRPYDGALTGGDFFFIKQDSQLKAHKDYF